MYFFVQLGTGYNNIWDGVFFKKLRPKCYPIYVFPLPAVI